MTIDPTNPNHFKPRTKEEVREKLPQELLDGLKAIPDHLLKEEGITRKEIEDQLIGEITDHLNGGTMDSLPTPIKDGFEQLWIALFGHVKDEQVKEEVRRVFYYGASCCLSALTPNQKPTVAHSLLMGRALRQEIALWKRQDMQNMLMAALNAMMPPANDKPV